MTPPERLEVAALADDLYRAGISVPRGAGSVEFYRDIATRLATFGWRRAAAAEPLRGALEHALHEVGGEFCDPFDEDHPEGMHNSQAAALRAALEATAPSTPEPALDVKRAYAGGFREAVQQMATWIAVRRGHVTLVDIEKHLAAALTSEPRAADG